MGDDPADEHADLDPGVPDIMGDDPKREQSDSHRRLERAYESEKPRLMARLRAAGKTLEEAEDLIHDVYAETMERLPVINGIRNLPAWINSMLRRRVIDAWRHDKVREATGEVDVAEETLREIISGVGLNPLDSFVRESMMEAMNSALRALPAAQRRVVEAQVFGGLTFRQIAESTGESIDTLTARKRYALRNLSRALKSWIDD
jgi:RNA polymerase sigma factor (sigma-70 family)